MLARNIVGPKQCWPEVVLVRERDRQLPSCQKSAAHYGTFMSELKEVLVLRAVLVVISGGPKRGVGRKRSVGTVYERTDPHWVRPFGEKKKPTNCAENSPRRGEQSYFFCAFFL